MPRYFFDVHDDGPAEWDDVGRECETSGEITRHAVGLIALARARQKASQRFGTTTTVIVQREEGGIVLSKALKEPDSLAEQILVFRSFIKLLFRPR